MDFDGIDIGAQVVAGHAGRCFDAQDVFGGEALAGLQPLPDGGGRNVAAASKGGLRTDAFDCLQQCFEWGGAFNHG